MYVYKSPMSHGRSKPVKDCQYQQSGFAIRICLMLNKNIIYIQMTGTGDASPGHRQ